MLGCSCSHGEGLGLFSPEEKQALGSIQWWQDLCVSPPLYRSSHINSTYSNATRNYSTGLHFKVTKKMKTSYWMELGGWEQVRLPTRRAEAGST